MSVGRHPGAIRAPFGRLILLVRRRRLVGAQRGVTQSSTSVSDDRLLLGHVQQRLQQRNLDHAPGPKSDDLHFVTAPRFAQGAAPVSVRFLRLAGQLDRPAPGRRDGASCRSKHNPGRVRDAEKTACTLWFETLSRGDVALVGGKNSSLGEMVQQLGRKGIKVPGGFATTADAYRAYLAANALNDRIARTLQHWQDHKISLHEAGSQVRAMILEGNWPKDIEADILAAYRELSQIGRAHV